MTSGNGNGKPSETQLSLLTSIDERLQRLVEGQRELVEGQRELVEGQRELVEGQRELANRVTRVETAVLHLDERVERVEHRLDNMLDFMGRRDRIQDERLDAIEARLAKAGI